MRFIINKKAAYFVLLVMYKAVDTFDYQSTLLMTPVLKETFNLTKNRVSYFTMSYSNIQAFFSVPVAIVLSRIFCKLTGLITLLLLLACYLSFIFLKGLFEIMLVRYLTSFFLNVVSIIMDVYIQACFMFEERMNIQNNMHLITDIANILIPLIISSFINKVNYNQVYIINLCIVGLMLIFTLVFVCFDVEYLQKVTWRNVFKDVKGIVLLTLIMTEFIISLIIQYYNVKIIHFLFLLGTLIQTGFISKTLMVIQLSQACIHAINQFVIVQIVEKQKLSLYNSLRSCLSLSSALMQPWLQSKIHITKYIVLLDLTQLCIQLAKVVVVNRQNQILSVYCVETLPNAMINQYIHNLVFNQRVQQCKTIGLAIQLMQIAASYGTMLGSTYQQATQGEFNLYTYVWISVIACLYLVEYLFIIIVDGRDVTLRSDEQEKGAIVQYTNDSTSQQSLILNPKRAEAI